MLKLVRIKVALSLALCGSILLYVFVPTSRMSSDFPQTITERLEKHEDVYLPDIDKNVRSFCVVGSYENMKESLHERGLQSEIDFDVDEGDTALVLVGPNDDLQYHVYSFWKYDTKFEGSACYPAIHNRMVFKQTPYGERSYNLTVERVKESAAP